MRARPLTLGLLFAMAFCVAVPATIPQESAATDYAAAFQRIKGLVGEWDETDAPNRRVVYRLTGNGSVLLEEFHGKPTMTSVYHMDGHDLRLTHYCNAGNQPRMNATAYDPARDAVKFDFVDVTNLSAPTAYHTRELEIVFLNEDHVELRFNGRKNGQPVPGTVSLVRRK